MNYSQKINQIITYYKLTPLKFAQTMQIQRSTLSHINNGRNKPSIEFLEKLHYNFPNISIDWFIGGIKSMLKIEEHEKKLNNFNNIQIKKKCKNILSKKNKFFNITNNIDNININNKLIKKILLKKIIKIIWFYSNNTFEVFINNK